MKNNSKFIIGLLVLFLFISCKTAQKKQEKEKEEKEYANYLETYHSDFFQKYSKRQVIYYDYFDKFLAYKREQERQIQLKKSDLKLNEVYYYYYGDICLVLFSDDGRMYHNKFNINHRFVDVIGDTLVKIKEPIELWSYANFELKDNKLYTLTKERVPYSEWYETITYNFRNDSIIADKMYKSNLHHKKKWLATTREAYNIRMVCKPTLEVAEDFVIIEGHKIKHYIVTGEFLLK